MHFVGRVLQDPIVRKDDGFPFRRPASAWDLPFHLGRLG